MSVFCFILIKATQYTINIFNSSSSLHFTSHFSVTAITMTSSTYSHKDSFYPTVDFTNPETNSPFYPSSTSSSSMYPSIHTNNVSIQNPSPQEPYTTKPFEQVLVTVPGVILHLIEKHSSIQLASGDLTIVCIREGDAVVAVLARIDDLIQWPLAKDVSSVKLDESHYFFTLRIPQDEEKEKTFQVLNYGLTIAAKGQEDVLKELDEVLDKYSFRSEEKVEDGVRGWEVLDGSVTKETSPEELKSSGEKRELMEESSGAYWTTLAPNVEDYSGRFAKWIAAGSGQVVRGILWCGDVTVERLKWGNDYLMKRMQPNSDSQINPHTIEMMKRF